jgi:hypothetical protein
MFLKYLSEEVEGGVTMTKPGMVWYGIDFRPIESAFVFVNMMLLAAGKPSRGGRLRTY